MLNRLEIKTVKFKNIWKDGMPLPYHGFMAYFGGGPNFLI